MAVAVRELAHGVHEIPGPAHNPRVLAYHEATTLRASTDEVPWCSSFVNWCLQAVGAGGTRSAAARSWVTWGQQVFLPTYGAIVVFSRGPNPAQGHVGFCVDADANQFWVLGGNQGNAVSITTMPAVRMVTMRWPADA